MTDLSDDSRSTKRRRVRRKIAVVGLAVVLIAGLFFDILANPLISSRKSLDRAVVLMQAGQFQDAADVALSVLEHQPGNNEAALVAAECLNTIGRKQRAAKILKSVSNDALSPPQLFLKAELLYRELYQLSLAEQAYRQFLQQRPKSLEGNEALAKLLASTGRRTDAIPFVLRLIQLGHNTDLIVLLAKRGGGIQDVPLWENAAEAAPDDPLPILGQAWSQAAEGNSAAAISFLETAIEMAPKLGVAWAMLGTELVQTGDFERLAEWSNRLPEEAEAYAQTWLARASLSEHLGQRSATIRCFWEAVKREPESQQAVFGLARLLDTESHPKAAAYFKHLAQQRQELETIQNKAFFSSRQATFDDLLTLIQQLQESGRLWEAYAWSEVAMGIHANHKKVRAVHSGLKEQVSSLSLRQTVAASRPENHFDFSDLPLPKFESGDSKIAEEKHIQTTADASLSDFAFASRGKDVGFDFTFKNGADWPPVKMFQVTGGGIGVIDFDQDGLPDLFCTQGGLNSDPLVESKSRDKLFANRNGNRLVEVGELAGITDTSFGQGIAVGDINSDGFSDIYVANIGPNQLWLSNGDGTFTKTDSYEFLQQSKWTTSCMMADLDGDSYLDLYDVNYLAGPQLFTKVCPQPDGIEAMCMPYDFDGAVDQLWTSNRRGGFDDANEHIDMIPDGKGLGIVAWRGDQSDSLTILVANDTTANYLFRRELVAGTWRLSERGLLSGIAFNADGKAEGCMGIAVGDVSGDGQMDVHITNFLSESNTLYSPSTPEIFHDLTNSVGLTEPTFRSLGFGTQFEDVDLDGTLELFVANGHIQDLRSYGRPFQMHPQLFQWKNGQFQLIETQSREDYFDQQWLGRSVASFDWNRDRKTDFVIGHLDTPYVLLQNETAKVGNSLALRLIGVESNRDAIGAIVTASWNDRKITHQLTAGDGYQASNERQITLGCGSHEVIELLTVDWPSGTRQEFDMVDVPQNLVLVEGEDQLRRQNVEFWPSNKPNEKHDKSTAEPSD